MFRYWKELSQLTIRVKRLRYHLVVPFWIKILTVYTGCHDKCFKNTEHQKLFWDTIYGAPYWVNKKYMVLFSPDFKYEVDSFNFYIKDNYVNKTIGKCILRIK